MSASPDSYLDPPFTRRAFVRAAGALGLAAALGSTRALAASPTPRTLTIAVPSTPRTWDPHAAGVDLVGVALGKNHHPFCLDYGVRTLRGVAIHDTSRWLPAFAQSASVSPDGRTWTLRLRTGLKFPSGNDLTAQDLKWSTDRALALGGSAAGLYSLVGVTRSSQVQVLDNHAIRFTQDFPSGLTPHVLVAALRVLDSRLMRSKATAADPWARRWARSNPTSGGAYAVVSVTPGSEVVLQANETFPLGPRPSIESVRLVAIPPIASRRALLEKGEVDLAFGLSREDARLLRGKPGVRIATGPGNEIVFVALDVTRPPLDDRRVRQALAWALPYDEILATGFGGAARRSRSIVPLEMPGSTPVGYPYGYDVERARSLLAAAGHGAGLQLELVIELGDPEQERLAAVVQTALQQVGVTVSVNPLDSTRLAARRARRAIQMQVASARYWLDDVQYQVGASFLRGGFLNLSGFSDPRIDALYAEVAKTADQRARLAIFTRMQRVLGQEVPWLMLGQPDFAVPMRSSVSGWVQPVDDLVRLRYLRKR